MTRGRVVAVACALGCALVPGSVVHSQNRSGDQATVAAPAMEVAARQEAAEAIIAREEAASGRAFNPVFRASVKGDLASRSREELVAVQTRGHGLLPRSLSPSPNVFGDSAADLVFNPVAPCRIINTRLVGGPIAAGTTRSFYATGPTFSSQGGSSGSCGVPLGPATAVVINIVAVDAAGAGDLRAFPFGGSVPTASVINYAKVPDQVNPSLFLNVANGLVLKICDPSVSTCTFDLTIQADVSATQVVADVLGYFAEPVATALDCTTVSSAVTPVPNNVWTPVDANCPAGRTATGGGYDTTEGTLGYPGVWLTTLPNGNGWRTWVDNQTGGNRNIQTFVRCCRIPGR